MLNKVLFPRELKQNYSQGNKKSSIPKVQKVNNLKEKMDFFGQKKQAGAELKKKKKDFWAKNWEKV